MKSLTICLLLVYLLYACDGEDASYTNKYDGINLDEILGNDRLLTGYVKCLLDVGPCTPDGKELKGNLPDAIGNDCSKCTQRQREGADQVMRFIIDHRPEDWTKLEKKYESDGSYKRRYFESKQTKDDKKTSKEKLSDGNEEDEQISN